MNRRASVATIFAATLLAGCKANTFRSPTFTAPRAPAPTVSSQVVKCLAVAHASSDAVADALAGKLAQRGRVVELPAEERVQLCGELGSDRALSTWSADWRLGGTVATPLVRSVAKSSGAGSVLLPVVRAVDVCDAVACPEVSVDVGLFLFDADGIALWKGTATKGVSSDTLTADQCGAFVDSAVGQLPTTPSP